MDQRDAELASTLQTKETQTETIELKSKKRQAIKEKFLTDQIVQFLAFEYLSYSHCPKPSHYLQAFFSGKLPVSDYLLQLCLITMMILVIILISKKLNSKKPSKREELIHIIMIFFQFFSTVLSLWRSCEVLWVSDSENIIKVSSKIVEEFSKILLVVCTFKLLNFQISNMNNSFFYLATILLDIALIFLSKIIIDIAMLIIVIDFTFILGFIPLHKKQKKKKVILSLRSLNSSHKSRGRKKKRTRSVNFLDNPIFTEGNDLIGIENRAPSNEDLDHERNESRLVHPGEKGRGRISSFKKREMFARNKKQKKSITLGPQRDLEEEVFDSEVFKDMEKKNRSSEMLSKIVEKIKSQNNKRFKMLIKDFTHSLDQCIIIFDKFKKSFFDNYDRERWIKILGKKKKSLFNVTALNNNPSLLWKNLFNFETNFGLQVQSESTNNILNLLQFLDTNMQLFDVSKYSQEIRLMKSQIQEGKVDFKKTSKSSVSIMSHSKASMLEVDLKFIVNMVSDFIGYFRQKETISKGIDKILVDDKLRGILKNPFIFYHGEMYIRISFRLMEGDIFCFLSVLNVGEKVLLLDLSDRLAFKNRLISSLSHELRTPLNNIIGTSSSLEYEFDNKDFNLFNNKKFKIKKQVSSIVRSAKKLNILIQNVVDYSFLLSKTFGLNPNHTNLTEVAKELVELYNQNMELKGIKFDVDIEEGVKLITDGGRIKGVLSILLENALKFTKQGTIRLRMKKESEDKVRFCVEDTGQGMTSMDLEIILNMVRNPLSSIKTQRSDGIGLGLRMAYPIIKLLAHSSKNKLRIKSELGKGTSIEFFADRLVKVNYLNKLNSKQDKVLNRVKSFLNDQTIQEEANGSDCESEYQQMKDYIQKHSNCNTSFIVNNKLGGENSFYFAKKKSTIIFKEMIPDVDGIGNENLHLLDKHDRDAQFRNKFTENAVLTNKHSSRQKTSQNKKRSSSDTSGKKFLKEYESVDLLSKKYDSMFENSKIGSRKREGKKEKMFNHKQKTVIERITVIIVDDNEINRAILKSNLNKVREDYNVLCAESGPRCLEIVKDSTIPNPQLIFMDFSMPEMSGDKCTQILRSDQFEGILENTVIIGYSALNDKHTVDRCLKSGMNRYQTKPITIKVLKGILEELNL